MNTLRTLALLLCLCVFAFDASAGTFEAASRSELSLIARQVRASSFLSKATFGPTQEMVDELELEMRQNGTRRALQQWVDDQFALPASPHVQTAIDMAGNDGNELDRGNINIHRYRYQAWWHIALQGEDQLRQRVAWALSQIFVIGQSGAGFNIRTTSNIGNGERSLHAWLAMSNYYDMLAKNSSTTYRELLGEITFHPCMGRWLTSVHNQKADLNAGTFPDENFAREIMQLFSIGLHMLNEDGSFILDENGELIPTYDNEDIKEFARLFTGFKYAHRTSRRFITARNLGEPMVLHADAHDNNLNYSSDPNAPQSKTILGQTLQPLPTPLTAEAAKAEIEEGLDILANHPNVPPFISQLLIQRLVKSNPSRGYVRRVVKVFKDNGEGVRGDMKAIVKAILTDPEAFRGQRIRRRGSPNRVEVTPRGAEYSRLKEPVVRLASLIRATRPSTTRDHMMLSDRFDEALGQMPYKSLTVFNFYVADFQPPGEISSYVASRRSTNGVLYAPEFQIFNGVTSNMMLNLLRDICYNRAVNDGLRVGNTEITLDLDEEIALAADLNNFGEIMERFDLLLCEGTLRETTKQSIIDGITEVSLGQDDLNEQRLEAALLSVVTSPDCAISQ